MRTRIPTVAALALALATLAAVPSQAAPRSPGHAEQVGRLSRLVKLVTGLPGKLFAVWGQEGAIIDPFGKPGSTTPTQGNTPSGSPAPGGEAVED